MYNIILYLNVKGFYHPPPPPVQTLKTTHAAPSNFDSFV